MNKIYGLFLLPEESVSKKCQKVISDIASSYHTQKFEPHITLIKNLELKENDVLLLTNELIKWLKPLRTRFIEFGFSNKKYRSVYIKVLKTQSLLKAHNKANQIFGHKEEFFIPHLSIAYGKLSLDVKLNIIRGLEPLNKDFFLLDRIAVYDITEEDVNLWKEIGCFNLK